MAGAVPAYNCLICGQNYSDINSFYSPTIGALPNGSGAQYRAAAPLSNLQQPILAYKARSINTVPGDCAFMINLKTPRSIAAVVIPRHNLSQAATYTVSVYKDATLSQLAGTVTNNISPVSYPYGTVDFEDPHFWYGQYTNEEWSSHLVPLMALFVPSVIGQYVVVQVSDPTNATGYIELSRLVIAPGFQPPYNFNFGAQLIPVDPSVITTTLGGFLAADPRPKYREFHIAFNTMPAQIALTQFFDTELSLGRTGQIFFSADPSDTLNRHRNSFLANLKQLDPITMSYFGYSGVAYSLIEVIA